MMKKLLVCLLAAVLLCPCALSEDVHAVEAFWFCDEDYILVKRDGLWGVMDFEGRMVLPCEWEEIGEPVGGFAPVKRGGLWGAVTLEGDVVLPFAWDGVLACSNAAGSGPCHFRVQRGNKRGVLLEDGTVVIPCEFDHVGQMGNDPCPYFSFEGEDVDNKRYFLPTENGVEERTEESFGWQFGFTPPEGYTVGYLNALNDVAVLQSDADGLYYIAGFDGNLHSPEGWDAVKRFSDNLAAVRRDGKCGFVDTKGRVVIAPVFDRADAYFTEGRTWVELAGERFFIDEEGNRLFDNPWSEVSPFHQGVALVQDEHGLWGLMDRDGVLLAPCRWEDSDGCWWRPFGFGSIMMVMENGLCGFYSLAHGQIIPCAYTPEELGLVGWSATNYAVRGDRLAIVHQNVLMIFAADGTQIY